VRLSFPNGELADVLAPPGEVSIGSDASNSIVLTHDGIRPHHVTILSDQRGLTLLVEDPDGSTHVNARPVKEVALLRLGDVISLSSVNVVLKPDNDEAIRVPPPSAFEDDPGANDPGPRGGPPRVVLRGVAGPYYGRAIPIPERLTIGGGQDCGLVLDEPGIAPLQAEVRVLPGVGIFLRESAAGVTGTVNGIQTRNAVLYSGDQIAFANNRFVLEAPGMPTRRDQPTSTAPAVPPKAGGDKPAQVPGVTQTMRAIRPEDIPADAGKREPAATGRSPIQSTNREHDGSSPWLLIAIGMMIAIGIALLLMARSAG